MKKQFLLIYVACSFCINAINANPVFAYNGNSKTREGIEYPDFAVFVNENDHSRTVARCKEVKEKSGQIICTFNQIIVRHADTKSSIAQLNKVKNISDKDIQNEYKKFCQYLDEDHGRDKRIEDQYKSAKSDEERKSILYFKNICTNPSRINVEKWMKDALQKEQLTCTIFDKTYEQTFQYKPSAKQWFYQEGPDSFNLLNDCGIINIAYIKKDSRKGCDFSLNYISRKIVTNKSGSVLVTSCSKLTEGDDSIEKETTDYGAYSNLVETTQLMNCKYINFAETI
jgi:hypothetical protein